MHIHRAPIDFFCALRENRTEYFQFQLIHPRDLKINGLDRWTDGKQINPIRVPFLPFEVWNPKKQEIYNIRF